MHALLPLAVLCLSLSTQSAPGEIRGRLLDGQTGAPVAAADVTIVGRRGNTRTSGDGRFRLDAAPAPPFVLVVLLPDGRMARPIDVATLDPDDELVLRVVSAVTEAVTVSGLAPNIDVSPGATSTFLTGDDIALRHPATLAETLETVPGVHFVSEGQAAVPSVRGLARGRTLVLVDGGRASTERRAGPNASFLDPALLADVEIARGPGSVAYGSDAFGGVIALRTPRPSRNPGPHLRFTGTLGTSVPEQRGELRLSSGYGSGGVLLSLRARELDDYSSPDGVVPNSAWRDRGVRIAWEHDASHGRWFVGWQSDAGRDLGRPRSDSDMVRTSSPRDDSHRLTVTYVSPPAGPLGRITVDSMAASSRLVTRQDRLAAGMRPRSLEHNDVSFTDLQIRVTADRPVGRARMLAGGELLGRYGLEAVDTLESFDRSGALVDTTVTRSVDAAHRTGAGGFVQIDAGISTRVLVSGGARADLVANRNDGGFFGDRSVSNGAMAGFGAVRVAPAPGLTLTAQLARGFRDPTLSDRFYRGPVGRGFVEGNPDLDPETSLQFDAGARYLRAGIRLVASFYDYRISDLIERYSTSPDLVRFRNRAQAVIRGAEMEAQLGLAHGLTIEAGAQYARGRDADDDTPIDDIPPATVAFTLRHASVRWQSYARIGVVDSHGAAGPSEVPTPGHVMLDAGAAFRLSPNLEIRVVGRNLLDERYPGSTGPRWVYAPGRHGSLTVVVGY